ncbi:MAG: efflux RND transporter permease subunit [Thermodesulfobacteriota bacterium]
MKLLGNWSIRYRVTVNLVMLFIIIAGILVAQKMRREVFPEFALDMIHISVKYPGSTPEETEEGICIKIEEQIKGVEGISRILSSADEGIGSVTVELDARAKLAKVMDDIKTEVDRIDTFPEEAEEPVILEVVHRNPAISIALFGDVPEHRLREAAEKIRDDLIDSEVISQVDLIGVRDYEISVRVSEKDLRRYALSLDDVARAIRSWSVDLPGGVVKTEQGEILIRSKGQLYTGAEFETIPLLSDKDGTLIRLGQIAQVVDGFEDKDIKTRFNGKPSALIQVQRTNQEDIVRICRHVKAYVEKEKNRLGGQIEISTWLDLSTMVEERIDLLLKNGIQGMVLVFISLALFLNLRLSFWVSMGIPVAFMGAFLVLESFGESINMISLFAFIMALGIVVDDAIIIGENIYTHFGNGKTPVLAVVDGLAEVGVPVINTVATTIVAFIPLLFVSGIIGKFIAVMPKAVIAILSVSLGEALIILPAHLAHALTGGESRMGKIQRWHEELRKRIESGLRAFIHGFYTRMIDYIVKNRYFTFAVGLGVLTISIAAAKGGYIPFVFFPKGESNWIIAELAYPLGTPFHSTERAIERIEQSASGLNARYGNGLSGKDIVVNTFSMVGRIPRRDWKPGETGSHVGQVWIELISSENRPDISVNEVLNQWRRNVGEISGVDSLIFSTLEGGPAGSPIEIQIAGNDFDLLQGAAEELKLEIATYPGTFDIADNFKPGKVERQIRIKESARSLGITMGDIARQLRQAFYGDEVLRIQRGKNDVTVRVGYDENDRRRISGIEEMRIRTGDGREIPLETVADIHPGRSYAAISRIDRKRVITVSSDIDEAVSNAGQIVSGLSASFLPGLKEKYPGITLDLEGQEKRTRESLESIQKGYLFALMGIFLLLATQFRSYVQPVIIMIAIPFGLIGALVGHLIFGMQFTMISIFGVVALSGIVVNDSLVLIDFINRAHHEGMEIEEAVKESGKSRFRAVLLTSLTTIAGLLPLLFERSFQAQFLIPMAVSITFGLLFSTVLTLLYVPAVYLIVRDGDRFIRKKIFSR